MSIPVSTSPRVSAIIAVSVWVVVMVGVMGYPKVAILALAVYAGAGAIARVSMDPRHSFIVRNKVLDTAALVFFAVALLFLGFTAPL